MKSLLHIAFLLLIVAQVSAQKFENLALTPPMGWNSWNTFACDIDEKLIREMADIMVSSGMRDAGYVYLNLDDCWHGERDSLGFIRPDPVRFPSGMKALADYVHSKGLKFGLYSDAGWKTCGGRPGSRGYEFQDAQTYASWGVDYLKYDWCYTDSLKASGAYLTMREALRKAGRPVVFSICEWGDNKPWHWGKAMGHLWRTTGDIYACFDCIVDHGTWKSWGVMQILDKQDGLRAYAGPGHWNDPDMMEVGKLATVGEDRAHFSMWAMLAAPLIAGNDLRKMSDDTRRILTNKEVIAVNQDSLGIQGFKAAAADSLEIWYKPLQNGDWAVAVLNRSRTQKSVTLDWSKNPVTDPLNGRTLNAASQTYHIIDLWENAFPKSGSKKGKKIPATTTAKPYSVAVSARDVVMVRLVAKKP